MLSDKILSMRRSIFLSAKRRAVARVTEMGVQRETMSATWSGVTVPAATVSCAHVGLLSSKLLKGAPKALRWRGSASRRAMS